MAAGKREGYQTKMSDAHRDKIAKSNILRRLIRHAEGLEDMKQSEVTAATVLLKKVLPDLANVELTGNLGVTINLPGHADKL